MKKILILVFCFSFLHLAFSRPQSDEVQARFCLDYEDQGYKCTTALQCATSRCLKETEEEIIPENSDVNPLGIRSPVNSLSDPCLNTEQVKQLTALVCPERRIALEDDELVCCHSSNIIKEDVKSEPPATPSPKQPEVPPSSTQTKVPVNLEKNGHRCGTHVVTGLSPRRGLVKADTAAGEWPHMCAIFKFGSAKREKGVFLAGASLIAPGVVLTVAHWIYDLEASDITVRCGIHNITGDQFEEREVAEITLHPAFDKASLRNDYGLLHLKEDFVLSSIIETICLPGSRKSGNEFDPTECIATGWGRESHGDSGRLPDLLKQVSLPIVDQVACQEEVRKEYGESYVLHPSFICAGGKPGQDTCRGDGGGPLVCKRPESNNVYVQAGIVSWGIKCGQPNTPGIYASTSFGLCFIDWATKCIHDNKFNDFYNLEAECSNWAVEEKASLEKQIGRFRKIITDSGSKETLVDYVQKELPKYEAAQRNLEALENSCINTKEEPDEIDPRNEGFDDTIIIKSAIPEE